VSNADTEEADVAQGAHEDATPLSSSSQSGHFIRWKRAKGRTALLHEAGYLLLGLVSLATVTGLYFWLDLPLVAAALTYLVLLVLLSLVSNLSSVIALSFIGVCCLSYFFAPPIYSFRVNYLQDLITISAFVITSFVVNFLVTKIRHANQRLEVTNNASRIDNVGRQRAEQALRESEYKLHQIVETVPGLVWSLAPDGEPTHFNQRFLDYFGKPFEDFKHGRWLALIHPDDVPETERTFSHAIHTGTSYRGVLRFRRADGEYRWHEGRGEPLRDQQGRIIQWYGLSVDIDEAKKAEDRLRRSEAHLAEALRLSHSGVTAYNGTTILYGSEETFRIWGFDPAQGVPSFEAVRQRVHPGDRDRHDEVVKRALEEKSGYSIAYRIVMPDGTVKHIESIGQPALSASGELVEIIATQMDVTERKRAEQALRELESDLAHMNRLSVMGELTASLAHEITQPIAAARNNARAAMNFLDMQSPNLGEVREALSCVVGDTDRAGDLIDRIRDHIKKAPPRKERFDLNEAINEVIALARSAIIRNSVSVQSRLSEVLCPIYCDRVQLQQVVLNLLLNAVEAMGSVEAEPRDLLISTEQDHTGVLVAVRDFGPGIDPTHLEHVFDRFYTTKSRGMGMGLSICRSIVEAHGGRLWATRCEPRGALFQFTIPAELSHHP
jgi:PAS domain S-box-containing protein